MHLKLELATLLGVIALAASCNCGQRCADADCTSSTGGGGGAGPVGGGAGAGGGSGAATFHAYRLTTEPTVLGPMCFRSPPADLSLPSQTFDVLVWDRPDGGQYAALTQMPAYSLGDSPAIVPPQAVESELIGAWDWQRNETRDLGGQDGGTANELRQTNISLVIAVSPSHSVSGTLLLQAQYGCSGPCPDPNPATDTQGCSASLTLQGNEVTASPVFTAAPQPIAGATRYLFAGALIAAPPDAGCFVDGDAGRPHVSEVHAAWLDVWQVYSDGGVLELRPGVTEYQLGDAPRVTLSADLAYADGGFDALETVSAPYPGVPNATETRQTELRFSVRQPLPVLGRVTISVRSEYQCSGSCPMPNPAPDAVSCAATLGGVIARVK